MKVDKDSKNSIEYKIQEKPPSFLSFLLGFQQFLTMIGGCVAYPYVVANIVCMKPDDMNKIYLMQTVFLTSGLATVLQVLIGVRLPLIQGPSLSFLIPVLAINELPGNQCPTVQQLNNMTDTEYHDLWTGRLVSIQGSVMIVGFCCFLAGCFGIMGRILHLTSPLIIGPVIIQLGLSFAKVSVGEASKSWTFSLLTIVLMVLLTQYLDETYILFPRLFKSNEKKKTGTSKQSKNESKYAKVYLFRLFPVVFTILLTWIVCGICTYFNLIPANNAGRVDGDKLKLIYDSPYFYLPKPFQWGLPSISPQLIVGIVSAMCVCVIETIGNYFACAALSEAPSPPKHAINRGVAMEGFATFVAGLFGTGGGVTSYSENISCIAMTRVASRNVILNSAMIMISVSFFAKVCGFFSTMPSPIIGGILFIICGIITAVGISILQHVNMSSTRSLFIAGISIFSGACLPEYFKTHSSDINFGIPWLNQLFIVLITNSLIITLTIAFILDNTIKCHNPNDRGLHEWIKLESETEDKETVAQVYNLPGILNKIRPNKFLLKIFPIFPSKELSNFSNDQTNNSTALTEFV